MNEEDIRKEAEEISKELEHEKQEIKKIKPMWWILAAVLALLVIMMIVPFYGVRLDPEPKNIPSIADILPEDISLNENVSQDYQDLVNPLDPVIRQVASTIASQSCTENKICQAKAMYYFVRDNIDYVSDPIAAEYLEEPREVLKTAAADCESGTMLLASMLESIGVDAEMVFITGHAFLRIELANARNKYKQPDDWIYLDWTCNNCEFGEIPYQNVQKYKSFVDV
jgi:transglutaminase-like putative cysteine protease